MTSTFQADAAMSVNASSERLVARLIDDAARLHVDITRTDGGTVIVDAGVNAKGSADACAVMPRICRGGLGRAARRIASEDAPLWPVFIEVHTSNPVLACLASQYAG